MEHAPSAWRIWLQASRPQTLPAAAIPIAVGTALAVHDGKSHALAAVLALFGGLAIQIGTNLFNDYADFLRGADTEERLGAARATQKGWVTPRQMLWATVVAFGAAALFGGLLAGIAGWPVWIMGATSILCGWAYTGGPYPLAYHGLGDIFVYIFFGFVALCGTYFVQAQAISLESVAAATCIGALSTAILVVNNLRDRSTDVKVGKRTLAVRFGAGFTRAEYLLLLTVAYGLPLAGWLAGHLASGWLMPLLSLPLALRATLGVYRLDGAALNGPFKNTAQLLLLYGLLLCGGLLF